MADDSTLLDNPEYARIDDLVENYLHNYDEHLSSFARQAKTRDAQALTSLYDMLLIHEAHTPQDRQQRKAYKNLRRFKKTFFKNIEQLYEDIVSEFPSTIPLYIELQDIFCDVVDDAEPLSQEPIQEEPAQPRPRSVPLSPAAIRFRNTIEGRYHKDLNQRYKAASSIPLTQDDRLALDSTFQELRSSYQSGTIRRYIESSKLEEKNVKELF